MDLSLTIAYISYHLSLKPPNYVCSNSKYEPNQDLSNLMSLLLKDINKNLLVNIYVPFITHSHVQYFNMSLKIEDYLLEKLLLFANTEIIFYKTRRIQIIIQNYENSFYIFTEIIFDEENMTDILDFFKYYNTYENILVNKLLHLKKKETLHITANKYCDIKFGFK